MANHSPRSDNYVEKKTWDEAMKGAPAKAKPAQDKKKPEPVKNEARQNGGGSSEAK